MNIRVAVGIAVCSCSVAGCECYPGSKEYINNAMTRDVGRSSAMATSERPRVLGYVPPQDRRAAEVAPPPPSRDQSAPATLAQADLDLDDNLNDGKFSPRDRMLFASEVGREVDALSREMAIIGSRAHQKGAAGRAAFDSRLRNFRSHERDIQAQLATIRSTANQAQLEPPFDQIESNLDALEREVREAASAVDQVTTAK